MADSDSVKMSEKTREGSRLTTEETEKTISKFLSPQRRLLKRAPQASRRSCSACCHLFYSKHMVRADCCHYYCPNCIVGMVNACLHDESCYPLTCCGERIPYDTFVDYLPRETRKAFEKRSKELDVPPKERIYCPSPTCSAFVGSTDSAINSDLESHALVIDCKKCLTKICTQCRLDDHPGTECNLEDDSATKALRDLALKENWKTCPGCGWIIERKLNDGCYSVTCRCRTEFCYLCLDIIPDTGNKNCTCPFWPTQAYLIRDGIEGNFVDIEEMLSRCKNKNVRDSIRNLSLKVDLPRFNLELHVPCDIENCHEQHRIFWGFQSYRTCTYPIKIVIRINHEPTSNRIQPSPSQSGCEK